MKFSIPILVLCTILSSCGVKQDVSMQGTENKKKPKNIILLIGDGTGLSQVSASHFYNEEPSNYDKFPVIGLIKTSSAEELITDSAAGATAFASGIKTYNGAIGVTTDTTAVETIIEQVSKRGLSTGLVATSSITHATPACFYAHVPQRKMAEEIAVFLVESDVDFFAGGGLNYFAKRADNRNLIAELEEKGFAIDTSNLSSIPTTSKQGFLLANDGMPKILDGRGDFLPEATRLALEQLSKNEEGFFLMIEGSQVDWGGHANDADYLISELIDFDKTIGVALDFAKTNGETLVVATADHETGGFTLGREGDNYKKIKPIFSTNGHSATMVPVFAEGPGSYLFGGVYENTGIFTKMIQLLSK